MKSQQQVTPAAVHFSTSAFVRAHGHSPRGQGSWAFCSADDYDGAGYLDHVQWFSGLYSDCKRQAAAAFARRGVRFVVVCS